MNILRINVLISMVLAIGITYNIPAYGQISTDNNLTQISGDSLTLSKIISLIVQNHPSVKEAAEAINMADAGIGLAKSGYYPNIDASAGYTRIGPKQELTFPGLGTFQLYPADNYAANLNYYQTIYDFGKTSKNVAFANETKNMNQQTLEQVKQKLAYSATIIYYSIVYLQQAIVINEEQMKTLQEHLDLIKKKQETGSATQYEILSTKVKISTVESMGIDLQTSLKNQITELNALMGQSGNIHFAVKEDLYVKLTVLPADSLFPFAFEHRDELKIARERTTLSELKYKIVKAQNNPSLNIQLTGGGKNGYIPDLNTVKANFVAGFGLKIPIFEGTKTKYNLLQAKSAISISELETELAKRSISSDVAENIDNMNASLNKIEHFNLQLNQSQEAFQLAQASFKAGTITNLDLLDAATVISESKLLLLKSRIEYTINVYKLKVAIGERLY